MSHARTFPALVVASAFGASLPAYPAPPPPPPPPPPTLPKTLDGYDIGRMWTIYGASLREAIPKARQQAFYSLVQASARPSTYEQAEIVHRYFQIEQSGQYYSSNTTLAAEEVCFDRAPGLSFGSYDCILRVRVAGALDRVAMPLEDYFDAVSAVQNLKDRNVLPGQVSEFSYTDVELFGLPDGVGYFREYIQTRVIDEVTCPVLREEVMSLIEQTEALEQSSFSQNGGGEVPWPHTGYVTFEVASVSNGTAEVSSLLGYNKTPVMLVTNQFLSSLSPCLEPGEADE